MDRTELCFTSIEELAPRLRSREVSPVEATEAALERIERLNPRLNAFVTVLADDALAQARQAERALAAGEWRGPLHGVPISLKDLYDTAGIRTSAGSPILAARVPARDATVVTRLREAGAVNLGKCNMLEFAYGHVHPAVGPSHNPWSLEHSTSGSSSGSGAAVAAGLGWGSMGSDTGGSIRLPAAWCGIVGIKPTYGLVPRTGVVALSWSLDHCGPMTRTVWDCAAMLQAIAGHDPADLGSGNRPAGDYLSEIDAGIAGWRIGVPRADLDGVDPEIMAAFEAALGRLRDLGAEVRDVATPAGEQMALANTTILASEASTFHLPWLRERPGDYSEATRQRLENGAALLAVDYLTAQRARQVLVTELATAMADLDLLALPTSDTPPSTVAQHLSSLPSTSGDTGFRRGRMTSPYNLAGLPAVSIPNGLTSANLPIGLQLVGHAWQDARVLRAARACERAAGPFRRPPID